MLRKEIKILLFSSNIWYFGEGMLGPLFAVFAEKVGGNILDISWAWATYLIVTGFLLMIIGKISDKKISKERLLVVGYTLNAIFTFGYLFVSSPLHLIIVQAGLGVAVAFSRPTWEALYAKYSDQKKAGFIWGLAGGQGLLLTGFAMIIGGFIVNYLSFTVLFIIMGLIQLIGAFYQAKILKNV